MLKALGVDTTIFDRKTGELKESIDKKFLTKQIAVHPIVAKFIAYKLLQKKVSSYGEKFLRNIDPYTGRIHSSFQQIMATGRTSSSGPNMQNIDRGKDMREAFRADEGNVFVVADFSNQELALLADLAQEKKMLEAFLGGRDIHTETARLVFNNPLLDKESEERTRAKNINFTVSYGGGASTMAEKYGITVKTAKEFLKFYFDTFTSLAPFFVKVGDETRSLGYLKIDNILGRKSYFSF